MARVCPELKTARVQAMIETEEGQEGDSSEVEIKGFDDQLSFGDSKNDQPLHGE
jgi:hypothetical protein